MSPVNSTGELTDHARVLLGFLGIMWGVWVADEILGNSLTKQLALVPRTGPGLKGILFSPLLHGNFNHISGNSVSLLVLGGLIILKDMQSFWIVTPFVWLIAGLGVWLFGQSDTKVVGASGIAFGYLGFLLAQGYYDRSVGAILIAVLVAMLYGKLIWSVFPLYERVSWQAHLFGFISGVAAAKYLPELRLWLNELRLY
ncbi:MAG TPA: rhomboid family intramembrane serine protease [Chroococcidiopsis sp.]